MPVFKGDLKQVWVKTTQILGYWLQLIAGVRSGLEASESTIRRINRNYSSLGLLCGKQGDNFSCAFFG